MPAQTLAPPAPPPPALALPLAILCSECGEDYPAVCPDLCGELYESLVSGPPVRTRPFRRRP